jgi:hypothetical protein
MDLRGIPDGDSIDGARYLDEFREFAPHANGVIQARGQRALMDTLRETATGTAVAVENRAQARRQPSPMAYVEIGAGNGGLLLNLSEGGLAIQAAHVLREAKVQLRFRLPEFPKEIEAIGEVVWLAASDKRAGLRFVELPPAARDAIRDWAAGTASVDSVSGTWDERFGPRVRAGVERTVTPDIPSAKAAAEVESAAALFERARQLLLNTAAEPGIANASGTANEQKKWSSSTDAQTPSAQPLQGRTAQSRPSHFEAASHRAFPGVAPAQPSPQIQQGEVKLPEIAWWVAPEPRRRGSGGLVGWIFVLAVIGALASSAMGWWQPEALLQRMGWNSAPVRVPAGPAVDKSPAANSAQQTQTQTPRNENAPPEAGQAGHPTTSGANGEDTSQDETAAGDAIESEEAPSTVKPEVATKGTPEAAEKHTTANPKSGYGNRTSIKRFDAFSARSAKTARSAPTAAEKQVESAADANTILVRAPAPGSLPVMLSLPEKTVAATAIAAVTSRREIRIAPAFTRDAALYPERVTVGRLLASSMDFRLMGSDAQQGAAVVEVLAKVGLGGEVVQVKLLSGPSRLASIVQQQVRQWRYELTLVNGHPVESEDDLRVVFRTR